MKKKMKGMMKRMKKPMMKRMMKGMRKKSPMLIEMIGKVNVKG